MSTAKFAGKIFFLIIFWVLRTLGFGCSSRGQLRWYGKWAPARDSVSGLWSRSKPLDNPMMPTSVPARQSPAVRTLRPRTSPMSGSHQNGVSGLPTGRSERPCQHRRLRRRASAVQRRRGGHLTPRRAKFRVKPFLKGLRFPKAEPLVHPSETWRVQARSLVAALRAAKPVPAPQ